MAKEFGVGKDTVRKVLHEDGCRPYAIYKVTGLKLEGSKKQQVPHALFNLGTDLSFPHLPHDYILLITRIHIVGSVGGGHNREVFCN